MLARLKRVYNKLKDYRYTRISYAQEGEDLLLARIFESDTIGYYIDVGAHHPKRFSNTYLFYQKGWRGINIDALPGSMVHFHKSRPADINLEAGISEVPQTLTYYMFAEPAYNSFDKEISESRPFAITGQKQITTYPLRILLDKYLPANQEISFLSVDVEGFDLEVLRSNNWEKYRPKIILVEILEALEKDVFETEIHRYILSQGYTFYCKSPNTVFYKKVQ
ncbi:FkbM family methyltransferase [Pontibacter arcticus]|uniref:SAM-dependent methyltransferase n=1 Tax=Pontibacter arcticus TaxID=2080288 RepID=A0A364RI76_9BACT|nr:FkbM family methyltransferase [Pontibacter arcticus]RAU83974.1 SAM-dependent methyltransferase [Pontibacter arcticus]